MSKKLINKGLKKLNENKIVQWVSLQIEEVLPFPEKPAERRTIASNPAEGIIASDMFSAFAIREKVLLVS